MDQEAFRPKNTIDHYFRLTYGKAIEASNQMKSFHLGLDDDIFLIGRPKVYTPDGFRDGIESLRMIGLDAFEVFYLNTEDAFSASHGAIRDTFTMIPSDDGQHIILCK